MRGFGGSRRGPPIKDPSGPHDASRPRRALPLAELLPLDVRPDLLRHDRRSDRVAAEHGLERVLAALEADGITAERLLRLRHVPSSSVVVSPRRSVGGITTTCTRAKKQKTPRVGALSRRRKYPLPVRPERRAQPRKAGITSRANQRSCSLNSFGGSPS